MLILVMGVTGAGKTTIGRKLAARFGFAFHEGDDFHPPENRAKMGRDIPLDDADRAPWLAAIAAAAAGWEHDPNHGAVLACSALKRAYRDVIFRAVRGSKIVFLSLERANAAHRLEARRGNHSIIGAFDRVLEGQYRDLEPPERSDAIVVDATLAPAEIIERAARALVRSGVLPRGRVYFAERAAPGTSIDAPRAEALVSDLMAALGPMKRVLIVPPDVTRAHSGAGELTVHAYRLLSRSATVDVMPALGTHRPMTSVETDAMFPGIPRDRFLTHDFRDGLVSLGEIPASFVRELSQGKVDRPIRCDLDARLVTGRYDRILSIGQLVPHEVAGIAGHSKNVFIGLGGKQIIDGTHFLGAVCGMESAMGRVFSPVRDVLSYAAAELAPPLPITHLMTVRAKDGSGRLCTRGLFAGDDDACFYAGAPLARELNIELVDRPVSKVVVYLDPREFRSTWLGNKAIYRTRMALSDHGELWVLAPGIETFGEDPALDALIRRHGYRGTAHTLAQVEADPELGASLAAAAHLIHGSSEGRFRIRYATDRLDRVAIEAVGYEYVPLAQALSRYDPARLSDGKNVLPDGEEVFFVSNPALGLWAARDRFTEASEPAVSATDARPSLRGAGS